MSSPYGDVLVCWWFTEKRSQLWYLYDKCQLHRWNNAFDKKGNYKTPGKNQIKSIYSISDEAFHETLKYFEECGGDTKKVIVLLNNHVIDKRFYVERETLLDKSR